MNSFPFQLPDSLKSHLELYQKDPEKAISRLTRHLKRRGNDAVGYFLLGWFYLQQGRKDEAQLCAGKAKAFAPGSPFFNYLPYYFQHPALFEAWLPDTLHHSRGSMRKGKKPNRFFIDIDHLISRLSNPEVSRIKMKKEDLKTEVKHIPLKDGDGIATTTLARIYENQQQFKKAICTYEQILKREPQRSDELQAEITRLRQIVAKDQV